MFKKYFSTSFDIYENGKKVEPVQYLLKNFKEIETNNIYYQSQINGIESRIQGLESKITELNNRIPSNKVIIICKKNLGFLLSGFCISLGLGFIYNHQFEKKII